MSRARGTSGWRLLACGVASAGAVGAPWSGIRVNWTSSMPVGLYVQTGVRLERGSTVLVCLPDAIAEVGRSRGYLPAGGCADGSSPVVKQILAVPGDVVELQEQFVAVNHHRVEESGIRASDSLGRPMEHAPFGPWTVRHGELWLIGLHRERSWDSRYFGPVPTATVMGSARPILTYNRRGR